MGVEEAAGPQPGNILGHEDACKLSARQGSEFPARCFGPAWPSWVSAFRPRAASDEQLLWGDAQGGSPIIGIPTSQATMHCITEHGEIPHLFFICMTKIDGEASVAGFLRCLRRSVATRQPCAAGNGDVDAEQFE
jgi:hypothetical protein